MALIVGKFGPFQPGQGECWIPGRVVHFGEQYGELFAWSLVETEDPSRGKAFAIIPTGEPLGNRAHYKTHVQDSGLVWHLVL